VRFIKSCKAKSQVTLLVKNSEIFKQFIIQKIS
jgi:hypothetical protein